MGAKRRNLGGLIFIDLRDREGIVQIVVNPETAATEVAEAADKARNEFVLEVTGKVVERASKNDKIKTGGIEIERLLSKFCPLLKQHLLKSKMMLKYLMIHV